MLRRLLPFAAVMGVMVGALPAIAAEPESFPKTILIIRHAEKPTDEASVDLNAEGMKRAEALPKLFKKSETRPNPLPTPDFIFATKNTKSSHRPLETVTPLGKALKLTISSDLPDADYAKLAEEIFHHKKYRGKTVLISWHHGMIPALARSLKADDAPDKWSGTAFDRVWHITYDSTGKATFSNLPQRLLPGDSEK